MTPTISIITITYNAEKYLERTIQSIIHQSVFSDVEYIVVDGKSKDATCDIIKQYESSISKWVSEPDKGLYDAMNKGISMATGDYLLFMNAGDRIKDNDSLEKMLQGANDADFIYADAIYSDEQGRERSWHKKPPAQRKMSANAFLHGMVICHQCMLVRRSITPFFDMRYRVSADIDWAIRLAKSSRTFYYYNEVFCLYLDGGVSDKNRMRSVKERFMISVRHFGWFRTLSMQLYLLLRFVRRGRVS